MDNFMRAVCFKKRDPEREKFTPYHREFGILLFSIAVIIFSMVLRFDGTGGLALPGWEQPLPPLCFSRIFHQLECPGCGISRSVVAAGHGNLALSWQYHHFGIILFLYLACQIPYRLYTLYQLYHRQSRPSIISRPQARLAGSLVGILVIINWLFFQ